MALKVSGVSMTFPGTRALSDVSLTVRRGEVHGLLGHNGSGKSTFIKILSGQYLPDRGSRVAFGDQELNFESPAHSESLGLRVVHQNLGLIPEMSVTENVLLGAGYNPSFGGRIVWRREHRRVAEHMERLGYRLDPRVPVAELGAAERSAVTIARALVPRRDRPDVSVLLLDEVTATMPEAEIEGVLSLVAGLRDQGVSVIYVTHHLEEVLGLCDTVTVLRNGTVAASTPATGLTTTSLTDLVVGTTEWRERPDARNHRAVSADVVESNRLVVTALSGEVLQGLSMTVQPGRIVGVSGITGSGREEIASLLMGSMPRSGEVTIGGRTLRSADSSAAVRAGINVVPADRHANAVVPDQNIAENTTLAAMCSRRSLAPLTARSERPAVNHWISELKIRSARPERRMDTLSGGNQQKVILARCLHVKSRVLVLDEPTQGVDIGAVAEIHARIRELAAETSVLICSSDSLELASLCDEVIVLQRGRVVGHLVGDEVTEHNLDRLQLGALDGAEEKLKMGATAMDRDRTHEGTVL